MENQKPTGGFQPFSPQLCFSLRQKQPPRTVLSPPPSSSRRLSPPLAPPSTSDPLYLALPSEWCIDNIAPCGTSYLSRDKLLRNMFQRSVHYRSFDAKEAEQVNNPNLFKMGIQILGPPLDYWLTFPLNQPPPNQERNKLSGPSPDETEEEVAVARGWRVKCTKELLNRDAGLGFLPPDTRLAFPWVTNADATKFRSLDDLVKIRDKKIIDGFVECINCGEIIGIGYLVPRRFHVVLKHILGKVEDFVSDSEKFLSSCGFGCLCEGILNPRLPIISENHRKINWLFLFFGNNLGLCTEEQLRYFCNQRKIHSSGNKNELLRLILLDLCMQIDPEFKSRDIPPDDDEA